MKKFTPFNWKINPKNGFTLLELLIVIAILAILATTVVLVLNPAEYLKQSRDSKRLTDIEALNKALSLAEMEGIDLGATSTVYVSIPDTSATCANLGLPDLPASWNYHCVTDNNLRKTDSNGWVPVNFSSLVTGSPLSVLPVDPINATSTGNYYTYVPGGSWALTSLLESEKYLKQNASKDGGTDDARIEMGTDLNLWSQASGLVGYWNFDEGSGTVANDLSGQNNQLTIGAVGSNVDWATGKIGTALNYLSSAKTATTPCPTGAYKSGISSGPIYDLPQGNYTFAAFVKLTASGAIIKFDTQYTNSGCCNGLWHRNEKSYVVNSNLTRTDLDGVNLPTDDKWHHYVYVFDLSSNTHKAFIDGNLKISSSNLSASYGNISKINLGIYNTSWCGVGHAITGLIDEVRIYSRALSAPEIQAIYNSTK